MLFIKDTVLLHGGTRVHILKPYKMNSDITAVSNGKGFYVIFGNGTGYAFLAEVFHAAMTLNADELIYLRFDFQHFEALGDYWSLSDENHYKGVILFNYCSSRLKTKDILLSLKTKPVESNTVQRSMKPVRKHIEMWDTHNKLTVKEHSSRLIISGNRVVFEDLTISCLDHAENGDAPEFNQCHIHHDLYENTSKSVGITLYYWQKENA